MNFKKKLLSGSAIDSISVTIKYHLCFWLLLLLSACDQDKSNQSYFPLNNNSQYIYETTTTTPLAKENNQYSVKNLGQKLLDDKLLFVRQTSLGTEYYFNEDKASGDIIRIAKRTSAELKPVYDIAHRYVLKQPLITGTEWLVPARAYLMGRPFPTEYELKDTLRFDMQYQIISTTESIKVPAGTYENCLHIRGYASFKMGRLLTVIQDHVEVTTDEWYAKGIGLVKLHRKESVDSKYAYGGDYEMQLSVLK
ncbi:MAG: hypothetical protein P8O97_06730 [Gammaproteobacteria bacterium]|nr:hypothetical protein [Gammaproteobacteria bacterium]